MTPTPEQPQQKLEDYLKSCNDREYAEYIIATMTHGNSPSDFDKIQKEAIQAIRSRPITPDYTNDKCGLDKCLAIINRKVEERTATIRNATLDDLLEELNEPNEWADIPPTLSDVIEWVEEHKESLRTQTQEPHP